MSIDQEGQTGQPDSSTHQVKQEVVQLQNKENQHEMCVQTKQGPRAVYVALREPTTSSYSADATAATSVDPSQNYNAFHDLTLIEATYPEADRKNNIVLLQDEPQQTSRMVVHPTFNHQNVILNEDSSAAATLASLSTTEVTLPTTEVTLPTEPLPLNELNNATTVAISGLDQMVAPEMAQQNQLLQAAGFVLQPPASPEPLSAIKEVPRTRHHSSFELSTENGHIHGPYASNSSRQRSCSTSSSHYSLVSSRSPNSSPHSSSSNSFPSINTVVVEDIGQPTITAPNAKAVKRKTKNPIPDRNKDESYWRRRHKNNMAAKRSREAKRMKDDQMYQKSSYLEVTNKELSKKLENALAENEILKQRLSKYEEV